MGMQRDLLGSITELTRRLRREQATLVRAMAQAREVQGGTDESGSITVLVDDEGTARDVRVHADWRSRLTPAQVGAAVVAADGEAARRRATATAEALTRPSTDDAAQSTQDADQATSEMLRDGSARPVTDVLGGLATLRPEPPPASSVEPPRPLRSLSEISTAVLAAVDDLERVTAPPPPVHGAGGEGAVRVTLAHGRITECVINQAWLAHQDDVTLAHALREAVSAAATARVAARRPLIEYQQRLDAIVADARANLNHFSGGVRS
jgi:hypothetical protein